MRPLVPLLTVAALLLAALPFAPASALPEVLVAPPGATWLVAEVPVPGEGGRVGMDADVRGVPRGTLASVDLVHVSGGAPVEPFWPNVAAWGGASLGTSFRTAPGDRVLLVAAVGEPVGAWTAEVSIDGVGAVPLQLLAAGAGAQLALHMTGPPDAQQRGVEVEREEGRLRVRLAADVEGPAWHGASFIYDFGTVVGTYDLRVRADATELARERRLASLGYGAWTESGGRVVDGFEHVVEARLDGPDRDEEFHAWIMAATIPVDPLALGVDAAPFVDVVGSSPAVPPCALDHALCA